MDKHILATQYVELLYRLHAFRVYSRDGIEEVQTLYPDAEEFCLDHSHHTYAEVKRLTAAYLRDIEATVETRINDVLVLKPSRRELSEMMLP